jgi:hypothetical protein
MHPSHIFNSNLILNTINHSILCKMGGPSSVIVDKHVWKLLHRFDFTLYMAYASIPPPWERDKVIMGMIFSHNLAFSDVKSINRCRGGDLPIGHYDSGRKIPRTFHLQPRGGNMPIKLQISMGTTNKRRLGPMD